MDASVIIQCKDVALGYGRDVVLEHVSLDIPRGVFLPFVGPNGAGKTTLLRAMLGLLKPLRGHIETPFRRLPAGYVPQHKTIDSLFPLTVREIVMMGFYPRLGWWRQPGRHERQALEEALEALQLTPHARKNYRDLSGGTKQKTLVARALLSGAEVFILDEPTAELDEASERAVWAHLRHLVRAKQKTVLIAHHGLHDLHLESSQVCFVNHRQARIVPIGELKQLSLRQ
jgi:ABC-type Mn2+/Zn2+ transport system ATPase subunit